MPRLRRFYEILLLLKTVSLGALAVLSAILISRWLTKHRRKICDERVNSRSCDLALGHIRSARPIRLAQYLSPGSGAIALFAILFEPDGHRVRPSPKKAHPIHIHPGCC